MRTRMRTRRTIRRRNRRRTRRRTRRRSIRSSRRRTRRRKSYRFSSGMCRAIMVRGSEQSTIQPSLSLTRPVSGDRKWLGMRLQMTGVSIWTSRRGGHWGTGFLRSLRNMAAEMGMMF